MNQKINEESSQWPPGENAAPQATGFHITERLIHQSPQMSRVYHNQSPTTALALCSLIIFDLKHLFIIFIYI